MLLQTQGRLCSSINSIESPSEVYLIWFNVFLKWLTEVAKEVESIELSNMCVMEKSNKGNDESTIWKINFSTPFFSENKLLEI